MYISSMEHSDLKSHMWSAAAYLTSWLVFLVDISHLVLFSQKQTTTKNISFPSLHTCYLSSLFITSISSNFILPVAHSGTSEYSYMPYLFPIRKSDKLYVHNMPRIVLLLITTPNSSTAPSSFRRVIAAASKLPSCIYSCSSPFNLLWMHQRDPV